MFTSQDAAVLSTPAATFDFDALALGGVEFRNLTQPEIALVAGGENAVNFL